MAKMFSNSDNPSPEEITQQVHRKPPEPAPEDITRQTRVRPAGPEGEASQEPFVPVGEPAAPVSPSLETVVVATRPSAASLQPPRRTFFGRIGHTLFSRETRFGRFTRSAFATLVTVVFLFGVWAIVAYFLIYQPMTNNLADLRVESTRTAGQLQQANSSQKSAEQKASALSTQAAQDKNQLQVELSRADLLRATNALTSARLSLADKDLSAASKSLADAQDYLNAIYPVIEKQNPKQVETLKALFTVANNDLAENASAANGTTAGSDTQSSPNTSLIDQDLVRIQAEIDRADKLLK